MKIIAFLLISLWCTLVYADTPNRVWQPVAIAVCHQINAANTAYQKGDLKNAHLTAIMAYFKGYDTDIEPAVRITLGGPHVFAIERQFRDYTNVMSPNPDQAQQQKVSAAAKTLCDAVKADADALDKAKVPRQVFKTN